MLEGPIYDRMSLVAVRELKSRILKLLREDEEFRYPSQACWAWKRYLGGLTDMRPSSSG